MSLKRSGIASTPSSSVLMGVVNSTFTSGTSHSSHSVAYITSKRVVSALLKYNFTFQLFVFVDLFAPALFLANTARHNFITTIHKNTSTFPIFFSITWSHLIGMATKWQVWRWQVKACKNASISVFWCLSVRLIATKDNRIEALSRARSLPAGFNEDR